MKKSLVIITSVISLLGFTTQSFACLSSSYSGVYAPRYDIPSTYDLAISKLPIHSQAYYQWTIQNNLDKIKNNKVTLNDYDDLAVAYNKIGEKEKAIEILTPLVKDNPTRFSSIANLGSIYLNKGDYENGLKYLKIANTLKSNDDYDREYAQEKVYSYLKSLNKTLPYSFPIQNINENKNFADFALTNIPLEKQNDEIIRLIFGVENMVRFGNHDTPVSMEILGDLYLWTGQYEKAAQEYKTLIDKNSLVIINNRYETNRQVSNNAFTGGVVYNGGGWHSLFNTGSSEYITNIATTNKSIPKMAIPKKVSPSKKSGQKFPLVISQLLFKLLIIPPLSSTITAVKYCSRTAKYIPGRIKRQNPIHTIIDIIMLAIK